MDYIIYFNIVFIILFIIIVNKTINNFYLFFYLLKNNRKLVGKKFNSQIFNKFPRIKTFIIFYLIIPFIKINYFILANTIYFLYAISEVELDNIENIFIDKEFHKDEIVTIIHNFNENELILDKKLINKNNINNQNINDSLDDYIIQNNLNNDESLIKQVELSNNHQDNNEDNKEHNVEDNQNIFIKSIKSNDESSIEEFILSNKSSENNNSDTIEEEIDINNIDFSTFIETKINTQNIIEPIKEENENKKIIKIGKKKL